MLVNLSPARIQLVSSADSFHPFLNAAIASSTRCSLFLAEARCLCFSKIDLAYLRSVVIFLLGKGSVYVRLASEETYRDGFESLKPTYVQTIRSSWDFQFCW